MRINKQSFPLYTKCKVHIKIPMLFISLKGFLTKFPKHFAASDQNENISITYLCQLAVSHTTYAKSCTAQW